MDVSSRPCQWNRQCLKRQDNRSKFEGRLFVWSKWMNFSDLCDWEELIVKKRIMHDWSWSRKKTMKSIRKCTVSFEIRVPVSTMYYSWRSRTMVAAVTVEVKEHFQLIERPWSQGIRNGGRLLRVITYFYYFQPLCPSHDSCNVTYRWPTTSVVLHGPPYFVGNILWYRVQLEIANSIMHHLIKIYGETWLFILSFPVIWCNLLLNLSLN